MAELFAWIDQLRYWIMGLFLPLAYKVYRWVKDKNDEVKELKKEVGDTKKELKGEIEQLQADINHKVEAQNVHTDHKFETIQALIQQMNDQNTKRDDEIMEGLHKIQDDVKVIGQKTTENSTALKYVDRDR